MALRFLKDRPAGLLLHIVEVALSARERSDAPRARHESYSAKAAAKIPSPSTDREPTRDQPARRDRHATAR